MYDIIIIGAGPAGLTSAIYASRALKKTLVLEAVAYGGQILNTLDIENYPAEEHISGFDFATKLYNQAKDLGTEIKFEKVIEITKTKEVITTKNKYQAKSIILATGADNRKLKLENEEKLTGKGISYCATCDGAFYKNKVVAVQGGGNTAVEDAIYLSDIAETVYLIHRRENFKAEEILLEQLKEKQNVKILLNTTVTKLNGENKLESIEITNNKETQTLNIDGLFIAIGQVPETENFKKIIETNEQGYVIAKEDCHTNEPGIFVAGDNRTKEVRQLVTATSDGAISAIEAIKYIRKGE